MVTCGPVVTVHPRVCGERLRAALGAFEPARFIPACAGNALRAERGCRAITVHPRVCGERLAKDNGPVTTNGSSPRVRGTLLLAQVAGQNDRFIPACAGNAQRSRRRRWRIPVHPRVCGERSSGTAITAVTDGSSPRVRGTRLSFRSASAHWRFIPACAGNARQVDCIHGPKTVHPRVCGERAVWEIPDGTRTGSSPRVRGTLLQGNVQYATGRFIPACAGNAPALLSCGCPFAVHPRVCGERGPRLTPPIRQPGSSPRVRGTLFAYTADLKRQKWVQEIYRANHVFSKNTTSMVPEDETTPAEVHRSPPACGGSVRRWQDRIQIRCWPPMS